MALPVDHTYNQWKKDEYGNFQISNMVYKMTYRIYEQTHYDRAKQKSVIDAWRLSWDLHYNTINRPTPDLTGSGWQIAGQRDKRFTQKRRWSDTCKDASKLMPICSQRCRPPSRKIKKAVLVSTASCCPATQWRSRNAPPGGSR